MTWKYAEVLGAGGRVLRVSISSGPAWSRTDIIQPYEVVAFSKQGVRVFNSYR